MNKAYVIGPLLGLLVFGSFYWNFHRNYIKEQEQQRIQQVEAQNARIRKEAAQRKKAIEQAIAEAAQRKAEREAKEKKEAAEKAAFQALVDKRQETFDQVNRQLRPQLNQLKSDADDLQVQIGQLELQRKQYLGEVAFLQTYVKKAEDNVTTYSTLLDTLAKAEKARAEAAAAAAAAKKR